MPTVITTKGTTIKARLYERKDGKVFIYLPKSMVDNGYLGKAYPKDLTKGMFLDVTLNIGEGSILLEKEKQVKDLVVMKVKEKE